MGYTTDFEGSFTLDHQLSPEHHKYLSAFADVRHVTWKSVEDLPDPVREAVGLPADSRYYVGGGDAFGSGVLDVNGVPEGVPGLYCQWVPSADGLSIEWDQGEKFYAYVDWLRFIIEHFLRPWGYVLNGEVSFEGEDSDDAGVIVVKDNRVGVREFVRTLSEVQWDD